ncbi:MAG: hypothetical protein R2867_07305 [Caldilineaceae bacterium]
MKRWFWWLSLLIFLGNSCITPLHGPPNVGWATVDPAQRLDLQLLGHIGGATMVVAIQGLCLCGFQL